MLPWAFHFRLTPAVLMILVANTAVWLMAAAMRAESLPPFG
jgi:hypothetical protein